MKYSYVFLVGREVFLVIFCVKGSLCHLSTSSNKQNQPFLIGPHSCWFYSFLQDCPSGTTPQQKLRQFLTHYCPQHLFSSCAACILLDALIADRSFVSTVLCTSVYCILSGWSPLPVPHGGTPCSAWGPCLGCGTCVLQLPGWLTHQQPVAAANFWLSRASWPWASSQGWVGQAAWGQADKCGRRLGSQEEDETGGMGDSMQVLLWKHTWKSW